MILTFKNYKITTDDIDTIVSELKALEGKIDELIKVTKEEK